MKLTKEFLKENNACPEGYKWACENNLIGLEHEEVIKKLIANGRLMEADWLMERSLNRDQLVKYILNAASVAIRVFQNSYEDKNVDKALEIAHKYIKMDKTPNNFHQILEEISPIIDELVNEIQYKNIKEPLCFAINTARHLAETIESVIKETLDGGISYDVLRCATWTIVHSRKVVEYDKEVMESFLYQGLKLLQNNS